MEKQLLALGQDYTMLFVAYATRQARRLADLFFVCLGKLMEHGPAKTISAEPNEPSTRDLA